MGPQRSEHTRLFEREAEIERIGLAVERARSGAGSILAFAGPAGIGKTRLLDEARERADRENMRVLSAGASDLGRELPFGVARDLFSPALRACDEPERAAMLAGAAGLAARVLSDAPPSDRAISAPDAEFASLHGLYWLLSNLAEAGPLLLTVDDAHLADPSSLRLIAFLAPRIRDLPVAVALALRPGEPGSQEMVLSEILADPACQRISPAPLSVEAASAILGERLATEPDPSFASAVHRAVAGNPLLLHLLAYELDREAVAPTERAAEWIDRLGSRAVSQTVLLRFASLSPDAPALARAIAVLGDRAEPTHVTELSGLDPTVALRCAEELTRAGILRADELSFVHPVVRDAIRAEIAPARRAALHERAAALLAAAGAPPERVAAHLLNVRPADRTDVVDALRAAARVALARGSPRPATSFLRRAMAEPPPESQRGELLLELGAAEARDGDAAAFEHLESAMAEKGPPWIGLVAAVELGQVLSYRGEVGPAAQLVRRMLEGLGEQDRGLIRHGEMMLLVLAQTDVDARREAPALLERATRAVARLGDRAPRGLLALVAMERALTGGDADEVGRLAEGALADRRLFDEQGPDAPHPGFAAAALVLAGRLERADQHLGVAIEKATSQGSARGFAFIAAVRAWTRVRSGALAEAEADAHACLELTPGLGWHLFQAMALSALVDVNLARGNPGAAQDWLRRLPGIETKAPGSIMSQPLREAVARLRLAEGDPESALALLGECAEWERQWGARGGVWVPWRSSAARAHVAVGDVATAVELAAEEVSMARRFGAPRQLGTALRALGAARGGEEGIEQLREATAVLEGCGANLEETGALVDYGAALRRQDRSADARGPLRAGIEIAERCGAAALVERGRLELLETGARPRRLALSGVDALTPSELRVAQLAAGGMSNREIAEALFVTRKTVEGHLRSCFRKLGVSRREELASRLPGR